MNKIDRLLNLAALIESSQQPLTASQIRASMSGYEGSKDDTFHRMFERDKKDLLSMGVPLKAEPDPNDPAISVYRIQQSDRRVEDPQLDPAELTALRASAAAMILQDEDLDVLSDATDGLRKLGGLSGDQSSLATAELGINDTIRSLFEAIVDNAAVAFAYGDRNRRVIPRQIAHQGGHWYLRGTDIDIAASRTFRVDRITGSVLSVAKESLDSPVELDVLRIRPWEFGDHDAVIARVALDPEVAPLALINDPGLSVVKRDEQGGAIVELEVRNAEGMFDWLLQFLDRAELLDPPELVEQFLDKLTRLAS